MVVVQHNLKQTKKETTSRQVSFSPCTPHAIQLFFANDDNSIIFHVFFVGLMGNWWPVATIVSFDGRGWTWTTCSWQTIERKDEKEEDFFMCWCKVALHFILDEELPLGRRDKRRKEMKNLKLKLFFTRRRRRRRRGESICLSYARRWIEEEDREKEKRRITEAWRNHLITE